MRSFGHVLRELRLKAGLSQEALAERARMSAGGVGVLERGIRRAPQRQTLDLLASALQLAPDDREEFEAAAKRAGNARRTRSREAAAATRHNLPYALSSFVGRDEALRRLRKEIIDHRLVTVTGTGGVGKTRLTIEAAHELAGEFRDGVWLVELFSNADANAVAQRVAETLGVRLVDCPESDVWMEALAAKQQLLILDNCEHIVAECAELGAAATGALSRRSHRGNEPRASTCSRRTYLCAGAVARQQRGRALYRTRVKRASAVFRFSK